MNGTQGSQDDGLKEELEPVGLKVFSVRDEDASMLELGPDFTPEKAQPIFLAEAAFLLKNKIDQHQATTSFPGDVNPVLKKSFEYAQRFDTFQSGEVAMHVRQRLGDGVEPPLHPFEIAQIASLVPGDADEAKAIIPSLRDKYADDVLQRMLNDIAQFQSRT
jgi:DNA-directed RNA polymerase II subunit RPB4